MDLTPHFNQVTEIIQAEFPNIQKVKKGPPQDTDTFAKESYQLFQHVVDLNQFLSLTKSSYLSIDDNGLSESEKDTLDQDFQLKIQALFQKLRLLQNYEDKRQKVQKPSWWSDDDGSKTIHRTLILKFLSECLNKCNKQFQGLQRQRVARERQLHNLNFQNLDIEQDGSLDIIQAPHTDVPHVESAQLQQFELENQLLLELKSSQLKKVEGLHQTMVDIINMQTEITFQIEQQATQIENLIDTQTEVSGDLTQGNKKLNQAKGRNKRAADMLVWACILMGVLLLALDYVR